MGRSAPLLVLASALLAGFRVPLGALAARSCPTGCTCISNSFNRPDIETTVVDCSFQGFKSFPASLPNSTTELFMQVSGCDEGVSVSQA